MCADAGQGTSSAERTARKGDVVHSSDRKGEISAVVFQDLQEQNMLAQHLLKLSPLFP